MPEPTTSVGAPSGPVASLNGGAIGGPSSLRRDLLLRLRLDGPRSPDQLAARLGASRTGVLQQLRALEAANLVSRQTVKHGVGRPRHLYDVTPDAQDLFPSTYDALAAGLLAAIGAVGGDELLEEVFAARRRQLGDRVRDQLAERVADRRAARRPRPRAGRDPGRPGLSRRDRRSDATARSACASTTAPSTTSPGARRRPARPSWSSSARSSAPTWSARRTSPRATAAAPTASRSARATRTQEVTMTASSTSLGADGGRQPRPDPRAGRAREQPQGRQRRDPEAPADGVHRRLRLGQELAGVRHDRRRVAAADQRDLQRLRAGLHADAGAARTSTCSTG